MLAATQPPQFNADAWRRAVASAWHDRSADEGGPDLYVVGPDLDDRRPDQYPSAVLPPADIEFLVEVAKYIGTAALVGIIGARADKITTAAITRVFQSVRDRWRQHNKRQHALTQAEAVDAAAAAALAQGYYPPFIVVDAEARPDNSWSILLVAHEPCAPPPR